MILDFNIVYSLLSKFERAGQEETPSTPIRLVREMIDKLPPEIWSDPSKTFLDPACSTGTFLLEIVRKLNIGLASQMPDQTERLKHILTKQVWGLELSRVPLLTTKAAFEKLFIDTTGIVGEVNIYHANALDGVEEIKDMKFDVVVMNPPYQAPQKAKGKKRGGGMSLWPKFVVAAFKRWTKKDGYVVAVHPSGWRKPSGEQNKSKGVFAAITGSHVLFMSIHDSNDGKKTFKAGTRYDWYVAKKGETGKTIVRGEDGVEQELELSKMPWIPNYNFSKVLSILGDNGEVINDSSYHGQRDYVANSEGIPRYIYPVLRATNKKGVRWFYSSRNDKGHFGVPKVMFGDSGINDVVIDEKGDYGMTEHGIGIPIRNKKDGELLKKFLLGDEFKEILDACSWGNFGIEWRLFGDLREGFWRGEQK